MEVNLTIFSVSVYQTDSVLNYVWDGYFCLVQILTQVKLIPYGDGMEFTSCFTCAPRIKKIIFFRCK